MIPSADSATVFPCAGICLGIDPQVDAFDPSSPSLRRQFETHLENHARVLEVCDRPLPIKPNLAYFLRFGSWGIGLLESFCARFRGRHPVLIDGKFNEIDTSLQCYLDFAFGVLRAHAITINPLLGERTIELALQSCLEATGGFGRVYVLCATSQFGTELSALQDAGAIIGAVNRMEHSFGQAHEHCPLGLVVGAGRSDVLDRPDLIASGLPLLCPGLGPQGADWTDARRRLHASKTNSTLYPLSRFVFGGGQWPPERALHNLNMALEQLGGPSGSAPNKGHCS